MDRAAVGQRSRYGIVTGNQSLPTCSSSVELELLTEGGHVGLVISDRHDVSYHVVSP